MKTLTLSLLIALPCCVSAGIFEEPQWTQSGKAEAPAAGLPDRVAGRAGAERISAGKFYYAGNPFLYSQDGSFTEQAYTYAGCIADKAKALTELNLILAGLKEAKFPVLQSGVNSSADCIDYTIRYASNLDQSKFTYSGWLPERAAALTELRAAVNSLKKAGIPLILQASVNEKAEGIDYTVGFAANAELRKSEYVGFLPAPDEAAKAMADAISSLEASGMPVLQATVRTTAEGSDYLIWYAVPKPLVAPVPVTPPAVIPQPSNPFVPAPTIPGCKLKDQSGTIDVGACHSSPGSWRCYADVEVNGNPFRVFGGCYGSLSDCFFSGAGAVKPCN